MTVNNSANKVVAAGNGVQTSFGFGFIAVQASDISVIYTDASGNETALQPSQYTLTLNPQLPGQLWSIGGTVTYPLVGSPIATSTSLTILRTLSLTQMVSLSNQGNFLPSAVEQALDLLEMQLQQVFELFSRSIVAPPVDATAPLPLPPAAQRANLALVFDGNGNPVAGAIPASGMISSAMQPVVDAATLALGRAALGLGAMAVEGIGAGLQDDGAGNARVNTAITPVATNQAIHKANHLFAYGATGALTFTLDRANTLFSGFTFKVFALNAAITFVPNASDNFSGQSSGTALVIPAGSVATLSTDGANAGLWLADVTGVSPVINLVVFATAGSFTYTPSAGLLYALAEGVGGGGGGGGASSNSGMTAAGGGGGAGGYARKLLTAAQIGASLPVTVGAGGSQGSSAGGAGGNGGATSLGSFLQANGGGGANGSAPSLAGTGGPGGAGSAGDVTAIGGAGQGGISGTQTAIAAVGGNGGGSYFGGAGRGAVTVVGSSGVSGDRGGGGGGGGSFNALAGANGGLGGTGLLVIIEFIAGAA